MINKKTKTLPTEPLTMSHEDFVVWFMEHFKTAIDRYVYKRLIPNRYEPSDIKAYIAERILDILNKRKAKGNPIEDPRLYFRKLIDFYCIEYQRMHGYIYGMPKRPRCPEAEKEIAKLGFVYFPDSTDFANNSGGSYDSMPELGYIDVNLPNSNVYNNVYKTKGKDPDEITQTWDHLMIMILPEDRDVLTCLYRRNMSVPEASRHLKIAVSTAYTRRDRGLKSISGTLCQYIDLDKSRNDILVDITHLKKDDINITNFYNLK